MLLIHVVILKLTPWHLSRHTLTVPLNWTYDVSGNLKALKLASNKSPSFVTKLLNRYESIEHLKKIKIKLFSLLSYTLLKL